MVEKNANSGRRCSARAKGLAHLARCEYPSGHAGPHSGTDMKLRE